MGGVGDFLHYLTRMTAFLGKRRFGPDDLHVSSRASSLIKPRPFSQGLATFRELTGRRNIYCVSRFWVEEVMARYGYFDAKVERQTKSVFAFTPEDLLKLLASDLQRRER